MLPAVNKILYSTDLSKSSSAAFEHAVYLAKQTGAEIHILHIVEKLSSDAKITLSTYVNDKKSRTEILAERVKQAKAKLMARQDNFWQNLHPDDIEIKKQIKSINIEEAYPAETIIKLSKELDIDLIVMGSHEKGMLHTFIGSVAKNVLNHSQIPMLIIPLAKREDD